MRIAKSKATTTAGLPHGWPVPDEDALARFTDQNLGKVAVGFDE